LLRSEAMHHCDFARLPVSRSSYPELKPLFPSIKWGCCPIAVKAKPEGWPANYFPLP